MSDKQICINQGSSGITWGDSIRGKTNTLGNTNVALNSGTERVSGISYFYHEGISSEASIQEGYLRIEYTLPEDFASWSSMNAISIKFRTESLSYLNSHVSVYAYKVGADIRARSSDNVNTEWATITLDDTALCGWSAGDVLELYIELASRNNYYARVGDITLNYISEEVSMEKVITREKFNEAVADAWGKEMSMDASKLVMGVLDSLGITVEPEAVLRDVTDGVWFVEEVHEARYKVLASSCAPIADNIRKKGDARAMAGGKGLLELNVGMLRQTIKERAGKSVLGGWVDYTPKLIGQLERMGFAVAEFRDGTK